MIFLVIICQALNIYNTYQLLNLTNPCSSVTTLAVVWTSATRDKYFNLEESNSIDYDNTFHTTKSRRQEIMLDECIELYCKEEVQYYYFNQH